MKLPLVSKGALFEERTVEVESLEDLIQLCILYGAQVSLGFNDYERISRPSSIPEVYTRRWELTVIDDYD